MGIIALVILGLILWTLLACAPALVARKKGYNFWLFLVIAFFGSFLLALVIALLIPDRNQTLTEADKTAVDKALNK